MAVSSAGGVIKRALVAFLADGRIHSGERLAEDLGMSRAAVWKAIQRLRADGIEVEAHARRGYCLPAPVELLDGARIRAEIGESRQRMLRTLDVLFDVDSTNARLLEREPPPQDGADVCLAEMQHAGRGRRGRSWIAPFGAGLAMSASRSFQDAPRALPALSLAVGVAVSRGLARAGARGIGLKWPNDIWFDDRKVGGILIDLRAEADGPVFVVIGIGINVVLSAAARAAIEASGVKAGAVADACAAAPSRNAIAGAVLDELLVMLSKFESEGFAPFHPAWTDLDVLRGRAAAVSIGEQRLVGTARGIDDDGALKLEIGGSVRRFVAGDVSLRPAGDSV